MTNQSSDSVKILRTAIEVENNGLVTFLKFARQTKDETGKNMFIQLAMDEHEHRLILEKQLNKLEEKLRRAEVKLEKKRAKATSNVAQRRERAPCKNRSYTRETDPIVSTLVGLTSVRVMRS